MPSENIVLYRSNNCGLLRSYLVSLKPRNISLRTPKTPNIPLRTQLIKKIALRCRISPKIQRFPALWKSDSIGVA